MKSTELKSRTNITKMGLTLSLLLMIFSTLNGQNNVQQFAAGKKSATSLSSTFKSSSIGFVKNVGQVYDYNKQLAQAVLYSLNADNSSIFITNTGITYSLIERDQNQLTGRFDDMKKVKTENNCPDKKVARLDLQLTGASILKENITEQLLSTDVKLSYYGASLSTDAVNMNYCRQLTIKNIYPHIDWVLKITNEQTFKYDFIVHPGADANLIQLKYTGANSLRLNSTKDEITATTALGKITEGKLFCYTQDDEQKVDAYYHLLGDSVKINLSTYNKKQTLVIDPAIEMALTWSTFYGGGSTGGGGGTQCTAIKSDEANNRVYIVGYCYSNPFPNYNNGVAYFFSPTQAGSTIEALITAFDLNGKQVWATYFMSTEYDAAFDVTTDNGGNVYMTGTTESHNSSTIGFLTQQNGNGFIQSKNNAIPTIYGVSYFQEGFIVKFNSAGQLKWSTLFGGDFTDQLYSIACDKNNNVYVTGLTWSQNLLPMLKQGSNGFFQCSWKSGQTGIIAGFNSNTELIWSTYFGSVAQGGGTDCRTILCDAHNNIYVTGAVGQSTGFPFTNAPGAYYNPGDGFYVAVFDFDSKINYCTSFQAGQHISDLAINKKDGSILLAGSTDFTSTFTWINNVNNSNTFFDNTFNGGDYDGFLILLNTDYSISWSTIFGGNGNDHISAATLSENGELFITGYTDNTYNSLSGNLPVFNAGGSTYFQDNLSAYNPAQIFIASFESASSANPFQLSWSTLFGDPVSGFEVAYDIDICGKNVFITGNAFLEPLTPGFPLISEPNGFLQTSTNPLVNGFSPYSSNGLILKFANEKKSNLKFSNQLNNTKHARVFPNPCADQFISLNINNQETTEALIKVIDASGRCVKQFNQQITAGENSKIDIDEIAKGFYFLSVKSNEFEENISFVKN